MGDGTCIRCSRDGHEGADDAPWLADVLLCESCYEEVVARNGLDGDDLTELH